MNRSAQRDVYVEVNGESLSLNGFVQDLFQEVIVGLIRSLGEADEASTIRITVAAGQRGETDAPRP